ncbi:hypothetical protein EI77_04012 [Prosthecobacter fusiformis]|uniref:Uncharacterized protein n=1 Tax=Prosthecobacter fusiformis TaxID=48464 RepID=A0A4R7RLV2_9BACT|nr:hypothetical protein [Prosthecobacter fusiformis]TDU64562.1 hypothetical protein EI77_04012 [Prosthecobacter fusiformis]
MIRPSLLLVFGLLAAFPCPVVADNAEQAVEKAHQEIWSRFMDEHNLVLDYTDLDGKIIRPTPEDCLALKPSALSWGVPNEDGPMFNGLYLDALCTRWKLTKDEEARSKARRLIAGLLKVSTIGKTPGFIARGIATDGGTTYPLGSNDQTTPWHYGIWRFIIDGLATPEEEAKLTAAFVENIRILDLNGWKMPTDGPPCPHRGTFAKPGWEGAPRLLFVMKAMHHFTRDESWQQRYLEAANQKLGDNHPSRIETCRVGMIFDGSQGPRYSWTGSEGVVCLHALWEMETDPAMKAAYAEGLRHSAELAAQSLPLIDQFDVNGTEVFNTDWRVMNEAWKPQHSEKDAADVARAGLRVQALHSPRLKIEKNYLREPCFAAWVVTLCPDTAFVQTHVPAIERVITHYRFDKVYLSQFFPLESAWWRLKEHAVNP